MTELLISRRGICFLVIAAPLLGSYSTGTLPIALS